MTMSILSAPHNNFEVSYHVMLFHLQGREPPRKSAQKPSMLRGIMKGIISKSGHRGFDGTGMTPSAAVEDYLSNPIHDEMDTFHFWKKYSKSGNATQKCLANLARLYLTPPPTSTDVERLGRFPQSRTMSW